MSDIGKKVQDAEQIGTEKVGDKEIPITNIKDFLGVLKYHGGPLSLSWIGDKVKVDTRTNEYSGRA